MKKKSFLFTSFSSLLLLTSLLAVNEQKETRVHALADNQVDMSSFSLKADNQGGTVLAPFDGIAVVTKAVSAGQTVDVEVPVNTSGNIAVELKNVTLNGVDVAITLKGAEETYALANDSVSFIATKKTMKATSSIGKTINLPTDGNSTNGFEGFNGYAIIPNTHAITSVVVSVPLDAAEKAFIGKIYAVGEVVEDANVSLGDTLYTPNSTNFTVTNGDYAYVSYLTKNTNTVVSATGLDNWEESRVYLPGLQDDGTFKVDDYKYLVMDVDYSQREAATSLACVFFRNNSSKYNADRVQPKTVYCIGEDGTNTTSTASLGGVYTIPAGFKGKLFYDIAVDSMNYGTNFKDGDSKTNLFSQMMVYFCAGKNASNADKPFTFNMYFTNTEYLQVGQDSTYAVITDVNDPLRGTVTLDTSSGVKVTPVPNADFAVSSVLVNGEEATLTGDALVFDTLTENKNVMVNFVGTKEYSYSCENDKVDVEADIETIHNGDDVTFTFTVDTGYSIKTIKANGTPITLDVNGCYTAKNINSNIDFTVEVGEIGKSRVDPANYVLVNEYAGGTLWAPFDGIGIYSKALVSGKTATVDIPVNVDGKDIAIRVNNLNRGSNTALNITLKNGETSYTLNDESTYYLVQNEAVAEKTGKNITLAGSGTAANGYYGFNGYVIIPNENKIDTISISVDLTYSQKLFVGNVYSVDEVAATYVPTTANLVYTPAADNFTATVDASDAVVSYYNKGALEVVGPHTGSDGWEQSRLLLSDLEEDGTFDISKWSYFVMDVDFSNRNAKTRIGFEFFRNNGSKYNADRANPAKVVCVGEDGSYYEETIALGGGWYIPAHFKGKLYFSLEEANMLYGTNFAAADSKTALFKEIMLYTLCQNNTGNTNVLSSLDMYFTTETLPAYETVKVELSVTDSGKGSASISTYEQVVKGSSSTVVVTPKTGYLIDSVTVNGSAVEVEDGSYTITNIQSDVSIVVSFTNDPTMPKYTWEVTKASEFVEVSCDSQEIAFGTDATFTFTPAFGYIVSKVTVNGAEVDLTKNIYVLKQVEADVTIEVEAELIPELTGDEYDTNLGMAFESKIRDVNHLNNFYSNFDSVFVSGILYSRDTAKEICPQPYLGVEMINLSSNDFSANDMLLIQYHQYHTQTASATGTGIKLALVDNNGKQIAAATGAKFYLIDNELTDTSVCYAVSSAYISGGMLFVPFDFSGYIAVPKAAFTADGPTATKEGFNFADVESIVIYDDYRWWSDSGSRYEVGDAYLANYNPATLAITSTNKIWTGKTGSYNEFYAALDGNGEAYTATETSFADFAFTARHEKGRMYFYDYTHDFAKYGNKGWQFTLSSEMEANGYYDFRNVNIIRFDVDNTGNPAINFDLIFNCNNTTWQLKDLSKVVYYDTTTNKAKYGLKEIPANFKGYVDIYYSANYFMSGVKDVVLNNWLDPTFVLALPVCSATTIPNGTSFAFDCSILTTKYTLEYNEIETTEYNITYELDGGTNAQSNPSKYNALQAVTLQPATKGDYEFQGWYLNPEFEGDAITSFEGYTGNITLYAKFGANFTITYNIGANGDVRPRKETVEAGSSITVLVFPDDGYDVAIVKVNGKTVALDENDSFVIEDIQGNITIEVSFVKEETDPDPVDPPVNPPEEEKKDEPTKKGCKGEAAGGLIALITVAGALIIKKRHK